MTQILPLKDATQHKKLKTNLQLCVAHHLPQLSFILSFPIYLCEQFKVPQSNVAAHRLNQSLTIYQSVGANRKCLLTSRYR